MDASKTNPYHRTAASASLSNAEAPPYQFKEVTKRRQYDLKRKQEKRGLLRTSERPNKRHTRSQTKEMETLSRYADLCSGQTEEGVHCPTSPLEESDQDSNTSNECDMETENYHHCPVEESDLYSNTKCSLSFENPGESQSSYQGVCASFLTATDISSSSPTGFSNQCDERGFDGGEELTQAPRNTPDNYDLEQDEMATESNMWKLRANRVKQILSATELGPFRFCKKFGIDFNVAFHSKQNMSVDSLSNSLLLEVAKFSLAMNSSQQNFIMEILEYNFDLNFQSEHHRNIFTCEVMSRVRRLRNCEDAVKFSNEFFELPGPMRSTNMINQTVDTVKEECDDVHVSRPHSLAEVKEHVSQKSEDLYPFCKEIGLKLHVNSSRPNKKLNINKLTNGAMTEVTNFAEELCGTFEQICVDILRHNFDLGLQSEEADLARNIVAWIPVIVDNKNLSNCQNRDIITKVRRKDLCQMWKLDCQEKPNVKAYSAGPSQTANVARDVGSSAYNAQNEHNLKLWQLRANHVQHILSVPHEEHCPFYSYSRCKKVGIDFNVGSGVKQNLDPKILTNGLMVELKTFATALLTAQKHFITEILEYNFHLYFKTELHRAAFIQEMPQVKHLKKHKKCMLFELPDTNHTPQQYIHCPKCYQSRNIKHQDQVEFYPGHMPHPHLHTMCYAVSADASYSAQLYVYYPTSIVSAVEDKIMDSYPHCKKAGLHLCVNRDRPKVKLGTHVLTFGLMSEVIRFSKKLCGTRNKIVNDVLEHNFNIDNLNHNTLVDLFPQSATQNVGMPGWYNEVVDIQQYPQKPPGYVGKIRKAAAVRRAKWMEGVNRRQLTRRSKVKRAKLSSYKSGVVKSKTNPQSNEKCFPFDTDIVIYRDMALKSGETGKLDSELLDTAVCVLEPLEENENDYTCPLGESDLDSDKATDSEDFGSQDHLQNPKDISWSSDLPRKSESSRGRERTQSPRNAPDECDMEQDEMATESNMWKVRANRVKQILSAPELGPYPYSKKCGLDFNVGFHSKQNMSVDSLSNSLLLEVAKFSLAMNSSQQNFIMEILEYNFDLNLQGEHHRNIFTCEIMNRVRRLRNCEDAVKFSNEVFELPDPMRSTNMINQTVDTVKEECDDVPVSRPHSLAEVEEHVSKKSEGLHPFCKEIGLKLHVNSSRPNKKLDINKLTNGAMTEVTNFAEELCGTFEQICVDILRHNFDLGLQSEETDLARNIVAWIPVIVDNKNLSNCRNRDISKVQGKDLCKMWKLDCQEKPNGNAYSAGPSQAAKVARDVGSSAYNAQNEHNLKLWQLRANHVQHILSVPHEDHCPFYSYSRCKKVGIDFNVGSGTKQNLDPKILTNGLMVELKTFATALLTAQKHFITEILEYNFHLYFKTELHRAAFIQEIMPQVKYLKKHKKCMLFELPDTNHIPQQYIHCPKCYQSRNLKHQDQVEFDPGHMPHPHLHTMSDAVSADANYSAQKHVNDPTSTVSAVEDKIMDSYPHCKKAGLHLCVDRDRPKVKLDTHVLTLGLMSEVIRFSKKLCGTKNEIVNDVLEHNFNIDNLNHNTLVDLFPQSATQNVGMPGWFNEVVDIQQYPQKPPGYVGKIRKAAAVRRAKWMEDVNRRQLTRRSKVKRAKLSSYKSGVVKSKTNPQSNKKCFPFDTDIVLYRDMVLKSGETGKLDSKLLGTAVCVLEPLETTAENQNDYTCPLGESDLDSDKATDSEDCGSQDHLQNPKDISWSSDLPRKSESSRGRERTQSPRNAPDECDMEQEQMGTESNMWKVRANRVKQILSATELGPYPYSKKCGLDFNVGFHSKQNMSVDSLSNSLLLEVAKFSLAMNSSQQNFIMEILEYNFDLNLQSEHHRNIFTCEIMNRVRRLSNCEDTVKFSNEVFELPGPKRTNMINQTVDTVKEECDDVPVSRPHSLAEVKEHVSQESEDLYPFCKEIGLKLHVNSSRPNKKLDINKLTNGAMTEVTNFAEELCGTFEQICVDILRHNFDLGLQSEEADLTRSILARIPVVTLQQNLKNSSFLNRKLKSIPYGSMKSVPRHRQNAPTHTEYQKELNLKLWQLRANHVQHILSAPHEEHCPLYSYSSCKKIGIDFNVGSGVKQNLDPKLLTNAVMVELNTFALNLLSAHEHFITEILEYNFHLHFKNELHRSAFANELQIAAVRRFRHQITQKQHRFVIMKQPFELPDTRCLKEHYSYTFCPKCYQVRDQKHHQGSSDPGHMHHPGPHTMSDAVSADANCSVQKPTKDPSSTFSAIEERIMDSYPHCKKIGLNLCVDKHRPKDKLDMHVLTGAAMNEVVSFARVLRGSKSDILPAVLEHNFNIHVQISDIDISTLLQKKTEDVGRDWCDKVFVVKSKQPRPVKVRPWTATMDGSKRKKAFKKRQLALQAKEERAKLLNHNKSVVTTSTASQPKALAKQYPICTKMGVDLEMKSKVQGKLSLLLLTRAMVSEIHKYASLKRGHYLPHVLFDILDHNFDLSSQHHRRWEFSIATASKINSMVKYFRNTPRHNPDKVFKLPFEFAPRDSQSFEEKRQDKGSKNYSKKEPGKKKRKDHFVRQVTCSSDVRSVQCFLYGVNEETWCHEGDREPQTDSGKMVQLKENQVSVGCGTLLQEKLQIKKEEYDPCYTSPHYDNVKAQSNTARVLHSGPDKPAGPLGCRLWANSASNLRTNLDAEGAFKSLVPVEAPESKEHSKAIIGHDNESTLVKEEEENVSAHSMEFTGSEAGIKQE